LVLLFGLAAVGAGWARAEPATAPDGKLVRALVKQLDDRHYAVRKKADRQLRKLGEPVVPLLRAELDAARSLEVCRRLERMIKDLTVNERVRALIEDLDSNYFAIRERADCQIRGFGKAILPLLKVELKKATDLGVRARLKQIIADLAPAK
jgi:hypothetical protein